jgi:hypothetical protein
MRRAPLIGILAALTLTATAFASAAGASTAPSAGKESASARQYLSDSTSVDAVSARFQGVATTWIGDSAVTNAQAVKAAKPLVSALGTFERQLQSQKWPSSAKHDVSALVSSFAGLSKDLQALAHDNLAQTSSWEGPLLHDDLVTTAATNKVRHDLGLPALSLS